MDGDRSPLMLSAHEGHIRLSAVEQLQALADIFQTDESSFCASRRGSLIRVIHMLFNLPEAFGVHAFSIVRYNDFDRRFCFPHEDADMKTGIRLQPMKNGIFQKRLDQKLDDLELFQLFWHIDGQPQAAEAADVIYLNKRDGVTQFCLNTGIETAFLIV